ncbi:uncharacterized protein LOC120273122 [Dioscorea cayenensis subsp. rotundata]|uniref:Uncharacterized protein LOC120273122 n=1 Tax=Dioscorea cayennensis subsp. rotundata TaxID=55577 RepID=A0AB40CBB0_DIOCR|nr:uncharacterized protein LOC120273122 [Dioscorea cayenensis subsp. rotundata]
MASQVEQGLKVDKGFKPQALHASIIAMKNEFGIIVIEANVNNHLRTIRKKWARIKKLKEFKRNGFIHKMSPYLNKPIEDHDFLEIVCGNDQATGRCAVQFGDEIGTHINDSVEYRHPSQTDSLEDMFEDTYFHVNILLPTHNQSESTENVGESSAQSKKGKGKWKMPTEVEAIQEINNTIKETLVTKKSTRNLEFAKELISECMKLKVYGYSGHQINKAYDWLISDDSKAMAFLAKDEELRKYWGGGLL